MRSTNHLSGNLQNVGPYFKKPQNVGPYFRKLQNVGPAITSHINPFISNPIAPISINRQHVVSPFKPSDFNPAFITTPNVLYPINSNSVRHNSNKLLTGEFGIFMTPAFPISKNNTQTNKYGTKVFYSYHNATSLNTKRKIIQDIFGQRMIRYTHLTLKNIVNRNTNRKTKIANILRTKYAQPNKSNENIVVPAIKIQHLGIAISRLESKMITHPISIRNLLSECRKLLDQLHRLHIMQWIHGDIHLDNVLVDIQMSEGIQNIRISIIDFDILCSFENYLENESYMKYLFPSYRSPPEACIAINKLYTLDYDAKLYYAKELYTKYKHYMDSIPKTFDTFSFELNTIFDNWETKLKTTYKNFRNTLKTINNTLYTNTAKQNIKTKLQENKLFKNATGFPYTNKNYKKLINNVNAHFRKYNNSTINYKYSAYKAHYNPYIIKNYYLPIIECIDSFSLGMAMLELFAILFPPNSLNDTTYNTDEITTIRYLQGLFTGMSNLDSSKRINITNAFHTINKALQTVSELPIDRVR